MLMKLTAEERRKWAKLRKLGYRLAREYGHSPIGVYFFWSKGAESGKVFLDTADAVRDCIRRNGGK